MYTNEELMKMKGETKVWKSIKTKSGGFKKIASTQLGQQIILKEALEVLDEVREWINTGSARVYRRELKEYFIDDEILLAKIAETYLFLAGSIYNDASVAGKENKNISRHKRVNTLKTKVLPDLSFDLAWRFLEVVIEVSQYFGIEKMPNHSGNTYHWSFKYTCLLNDEILSRLSVEAAEAFYPMPMLEPPIDWSFENEVLSGGYKEFQYEMIRANRDVDYSLYSQRVFDSINYIQSVPWRVNKQLLRRVIADLEPPVKSDYVKSIYPDPEPCKWDIELTNEVEEGEEPIDIYDPETGEVLSKREIKNLEELRKHYRELVELYKAECGDFESAVGKYRAVKMATQVAEKYVDKVIYFPYSFDFRGRIYPIAVGLSPQGSDAVKALLEYDRGEVLNESGLNWCWAYLASLWGDDKIPFDERIQRGKDLLKANYSEADEPYQFLAHQMEMEKYLEDPTYEMKTRIHLDACNSGSQFTSAITGDRAGCIATNVLPTINEDKSHTRQDAYILVAHKALGICKDGVKNGVGSIEREAFRFFQGLLEEKGRKICKTPVMVSNYGGTAGGRADILWNMLREFGVDRKWITKSVASKFGKVVGDSIAGVLNGGKAFETYIHRMNAAITRNGKAITWTTSDGFHVVHIKNKELKAKQVTLTLPGARRRTTIIKKQYSDKIAPAKMKSAISPNYIHSLDAELLRRVSLRLKEAGIVDTAWIHDSFASTPNTTEFLMEMCKEEFLKLVKRRPLHALDKELRDQSDGTKLTQKMLDAIKIPSLRGFDVDKGGLEELMVSNWFFS